MRQEVAAVKVAFGQHSSHAFDRRQVEVQVAVDDADLADRPQLEIPDHRIDGLPKSQQVWVSAEWSTIQGLIAPSALSLSIDCGVDGALDRRLEAFLDHGRELA